MSKEEHANAWTADAIGARLILELAVSLRGRAIAIQRDKEPLSRDLRELGFTKASDAAKAAQAWARTCVERRHVSESDAMRLFWSASTLSADAPYEMQWSVEMAESYAWALNLRKALLPFDAIGFDSKSPLRKLLLSSGVSDRLRRCKVRGPTELQDARARSHAWCWRAQLYWWDVAFKEGLLAPKAKKWRAAARRALPAVIRLARSRKWFVPVEGDFPVGGTPYGEIDRPLADRLRRVAQERTVAHKWLASPQLEWDSISADELTLIPPVGEAPPGGRAARRKSRA
ncbi:MAG: hypothetical protein GIKADHBN_00642 [Phycisphaerales bacterium]|nr:hypothetical protein [Phycisphaerales bacterium]MCK6475352.1 hypothetical protein [Phycisphaerales bacterium]